MDSENTPQDMEFSAFPPEMKYNIFKYVSPYDLALSRAVCRSWNHLISTWKHFRNRIIFNTCNETTLEIYKNSFTNWPGITVTDCFSGKEVTTADEMLQRTIGESEIRGSILTTLSLHYLVNLSSTTLQAAIASCVNLESLSIKCVTLTKPSDNQENSEIDDSELSQINIENNLEKVAKKLTTLKLLGLHFLDSVLLYNSIAMKTEKLVEFCLKEFFGNIRDEEDQNHDEQITIFLNNTKSILANNSATLQVLEFIINDIDGIAEFHRKVLASFIPTIRGTPNKMQLKKLSLFLLPPSQPINETYFWTDWVDEDVGDFIGPTELFKIWKDFIASQLNLEVLRLPHIELSLRPFEEEHYPALCELLATLPTTLKILNASLDQEGMNGMNLKVYQQLHTLATTINLSQYKAVIVPDSTLFLALQNTSGRLRSHVPHLQNLQVNFISGRDICEHDTLKICKVVLDLFCPPNLRALIVTGTILLGDEAVQLIVKSLSNLHVLELRCRPQCTDYGITGISKPWLVNAVKNIKEFPSTVNLVDPEIVGESLSKLEHLRTLKIPALTKLSDIGIYYGLRLPQLKKLYLTLDQPYNKVSDWGLQQLALQCPLLEAVRLSVGCSTTGEGIRDFIKSLDRVRQPKSIIRRVIHSQYAPEAKTMSAELS